MSAPDNDDERVRLRSPLRMLLEGVEGLALLVFVVLGWPILRPLLLNLGLQDNEHARTWPGDSALDEVTHGHARATSVEATASDVWPWLLQLGLGKAGFYSYELLERLAGAPVKNVEVLVSAWQHLSIDDSIELLPGRGSGCIRKKSPGGSAFAPGRMSRSCPRANRGSGAPGRSTCWPAMAPPADWWFEQRSRGSALARFGDVWSAVSWRNR